MIIARIVSVVAILVVATSVAVALRPLPETPEQRVDRIAGELRCPVCQALSVRDSPSETARAMRDQIARRVAEGRSDEEIVGEFRDAYGEWILLAPPASDARALAWLAPAVLLVVAAVLALRLVVPRVTPRSVERDPDPEQLTALRRRVATEEDT